MKVGKPENLFVSLRIFLVMRVFLVFERVPQRIVPHSINQSGTASLQKYQTQTAAVIFLDVK